MVTDPRPVPGVLAELALALALVPAPRVVATPAVDGPRRPLRRIRRCLDDVGDDWRSLLLGAPPARP